MKGLLKLGPTQQDSWRRSYLRLPACIPMWADDMIDQDSWRHSRLPITSPLLPNYFPSYFPITSQLLPKYFSTTSPLLHSYFPSYFPTALQLFFAQEYPNYLPSIANPPSIASWNPTNSSTTSWQRCSQLTGMSFWKGFVGRKKSKCPSNQSQRKAI